MTAVTDRSSIDRIVQEQAEALHGFRVMAIDGEAGQVAADQDRIDDQHLLVRVDGGFLGLIHHDVVIELDAVDRIDTADGQIGVDRVTDWVHQSPKLEQWQQDHPGAGAHPAGATVASQPTEGGPRPLPTTELPPAGVL